MAFREGLEPPTYGLGNRRSVLLSYRNVGRPWPEPRHIASLYRQEGLLAVKGVRALAGGTSWDEWNGAGGRDRTADLSLTKRLLSRLSYTGKGKEVERAIGFEPTTFTLAT